MPSTKLLLAICATLILTACPGDDGPGPIVYGDGASCNINNCSGCCQGSMCVTTPSTSACGLGGFPCTTCNSDQTCTTGTCSGGQTCDAFNCPAGCCDNGQCKSGLTNAACGTGGAICTDCTTSGGTCDVATQACTGGQNCSPTTCNVGCCKNNSCLPGNTNAACGDGGGACVDCAASGGTCDLTTRTCKGSTGCAPGNCPGCCDGTSCLSGGTNTACGKGGVACVDCASLSAVCNGATGKCESTGSCSPASCSSGCCAGNTCMPGTAPTACGTGGALCVSCTQSYQSCTAGNCQVDPNSKWSLMAISANIIQGLTTWDPLVPWGQEPDPYAGWSPTCSKWSVSPCSNSLSDTFTPVWNQALGTFKASELKSSACIVVGDSDDNTHCCTACVFNTVGMCAAQITDADLTAGSKTFTQCPNPDDSVNYLSSLKLQFNYVP